MNNTYQSINELMEWFAQAPRTKGWDAMLAFDQATTNTLLLQQYIERFNEASYLEPLNETIELGNGSVTEISNYLFDKPRLSFENANLDAPKATLRMQGLGGVRFNWDVSGASCRLNSIAYEYPVNGDVYSSIVELKDDSVSVRGRQVIIDVASGQSPVLKFGATLNEKERAGEKIKRALGLRPPIVREYVLSELQGDPASLTAPKEVLLLTQAAPGSEKRESARYGDGAVLAFISFTEKNVGDRPVGNDPEWRYLLDANENGHSALLAISQKFLISKIIANALLSEAAVGESFIGGANIKIDLRQEDGWYKIVAEGFVSTSWHESAEERSWRLQCNLLLDEVNFDKGDGRQLRAGWVAHGRLTGTQLDQDNYHPTPIDQELAVAYDVIIDVDVDSSTGIVRFSGEGKGSVELPAPLKPLVDIMQERLGQALVPAYSRWFEQIRTAQLANIVLAGDRPVRLEGARAPGDLVMYGDLADDRTALTLNQLEVMVGANTTFQFEALGRGSGAVNWMLELVDGSSATPNDAGTITAAGLYTAPGVASNYARVRLTATRGEFKTQALITVVRDLVVVSPAIQLAVAGAQARYFVRGGAAGDWQWDTSELKGTLKEPVPEPGDQFEPGDMQYIPPATIDTDFIVEKVKIRVGSNVTTSTIVVTKGSMLDVIATLSADGQSATLKAQASATEVPATFTKVAGSGRLEGDRVISEAQPAEPFIVVQGAMSGLPFAGYLLLPLPLHVLEGTRSQTVLQDPTLTF